MNAEEQKLRQQIAEYEKMLGIGEYDIERNAFFAICKIAEAHTNRLNKFNLENEIGADPKSDKIYDRTKAIWEGLPEMVKNIATLRKELGISKIEIGKEVARNRITPESISNVLGNTAGKQD